MCELTPDGVSSITRKALRCAGAAVCDALGEARRAWCLTHPSGWLHMSLRPIQRGNALAPDAQAALHEDESGK